MLRKKFHWINKSCKIDSPFADSALPYRRREPLKEPRTRRTLIVIK
uniref:Uncharacterized protein n=1 Tax=Tetranychus urticae TaxID=32264 RepID=A0A158P4K6_TETUR